MQLVQKALADLAEFHLPPWSDIRSHAEALSASHQYVTFLDVLPMLRLAQTMVHLPEATLQALNDLHDGSGTTDGARDLLQQLARDYHGRVRQQRALAHKIVTPAHAGRSIRLAVGAVFTVALPHPLASRWQWRIEMSPGTALPVQIEAAPSPRREVQRFVVLAVAPGACGLEASLDAGEKKKINYRVIVDPAPS